MNTKVYFVGLGLLLGIALLQANALETTNSVKNDNLTTSLSNTTATKPITTNIPSTQTDLPTTLQYINLTSSNNTQSTSTKNTTLRPTARTVQPTFVPKRCEQPRNGTDSGGIPVHFLQPTSVCIAQEETSVDLKCEFCATKPLLWTKILWYKDGQPIQSCGSDRIHISSLRHDQDEGLYKCVVVSPSNTTASRMVTLIVNKDPLFSMVHSVWARNVTFTRATKILWQIRGHGLFDALKVTVTVRQLGESKWQYKRQFTEFVSGSTELDDLEPSTIYIANVSAVNSYGYKECRSIVFWSNAKNSTDFDIGVLSFGFCTRRLLGLITGALGLLLSVCAMYFCCVYPVCDFTSHQGYGPPLEQSSDITSQKYEHQNHNDFDANYIDVDLKDGETYKV